MSITRSQHTRTTRVWTTPDPKPPEKTFSVLRLLAQVVLLITLLVAVLLLVVVINTSFVTIAWTVAEGYPSLTPVFIPALTVLDRVLGFVATVTLFYVLYRVAPAITLPLEALGPFCSRFPRITTRPPLGKSA